MNVSNTPLSSTRAHFDGLVQERCNSSALALTQWFELITKPMVVPNSSSWKGKCPQTSKGFLYIYKISTGSYVNPYSDEEWVFQGTKFRADSRFAPSQWETALLWHKLRISPVSSIPCHWCLNTLRQRHNSLCIKVSELAGPKLILKDF